MTTRPPTRTLPSVKAVLVDVRITLVGPEPAPRRPHWAIWLLSWAATLGSLLITLNGTEGSAWWRVAIAAVVAGPIGLLPSRPLLAWRLMCLGAVALTLIAPIDTNAPWPGRPVQTMSALLACFLVAATVRAGIVLLVLLTTTACVITFAKPNHLVGSIVLLVAVMVLGDQIRRRRSTASRLEAVQERTELEKARRAVLEERGRIAREMHDVVAHHMSMIAVRAETAPYRLTAVPPAVAGEFTGIADAAREAMTEMRRLLGVLRSDEPSAPHAPQPGLAEIAELVATARESGVDIRFDDTHRPDTVAAGVGLCAFRIVQEALSNATRHAPGAPVRVSVAGHDTTLTIEVVNGPGRLRPVPAQSGERHGLAGMRERAGLMGGELTASSTSEGGFRVWAALPLAVRT
jgi:signal transduction histidine kinase